MHINFEAKSAAEFRALAAFATQLAAIHDSPVFAPNWGETGKTESPELPKPAVVTKAEDIPAGLSGHNPDVVISDGKDDDTPEIEQPERPDETPQIVDVPAESYRRRGMPAATKQKRNSFQMTQDARAEELCGILGRSLADFDAALEACDGDWGNLLAEWADAAAGQNVAIEQIPVTGGEAPTEAETVEEVAEVPAEPEVVENVNDEVIVETVSSEETGVSDEAIASALEGRIDQFQLDDGTEDAPAEEVPTYSDKDLRDKLMAAVQKFGGDAVSAARADLLEGAENITTIAKDPVIRHRVAQNLDAAVARDVL